MGDWSKVSWESVTASEGKEGEDGRRLGERKGEEEGREETAGDCPSEKMQERRTRLLRASPAGRCPLRLTGLVCSCPV